MDDFIKISGIRKSYNEGVKEKIILDGIDLSIKEGEIIILLGKSGSGKSTLLNLLSGIDMPDQGSIIINNHELTKYSEKERTLYRRKNIGFVFQFFNLIPTLTVGENLLLPLELNNLSNKGSNKKIREVLTSVGLEERMNTYPDRLSGGEQQRIAIARALIHEPELILADEPTGNLDYDTGMKIIELLDKLVNERKRTMIMATHSRDLFGFADRIIRIKNGQLENVEIKDDLK